MNNVLPRMTTVWILLQITFLSSILDLPQVIFYREGFITQTQMTMIYRKFFSQVSILRRENCLLTQSGDKSTTLIKNDEIRRK